jgi:hypothetical protein
MNLLAGANFEQRGACPKAGFLNTCTASGLRDGDVLGPATVSGMHQRECNACEEHAPESVHAAKSLESRGLRL